ncbi:MAG: DNA starvation/stationary phase protection protein [Saprospiraceae bacterium]|nr:DNA starvation/stationary phase protection protein [Saprospiraceae bacterium]
MRANIGIPDQHTQAVTNILNQLLADEYVLYTKTRNYHWNVTGMSFHELHKFFEEQYKIIDDVIDDIAERTRAIGHHPIAILRGILKLTSLTEDEPMPDARQMLINLLNDHETIIKFIRRNIDPIQNQHKDAGSADFLTGLIEIHEKMAWMLRAF